MNKFALLLIPLIYSNAYSEPVKEKIITNQNSSIKFSAWDQKTKAWGEIEFQGNNKKFNIYTPLELTKENTATTTNSSKELLSKNGELLLVERIVSTELYDESGKSQPSEDVYCDIINMSTGCVLSSHTGGFCAGKWNNNKWENASGQDIGNNLETVSPRKVLDALLNSETSDERIEEISYPLYMGIESYLACHPPTEKNIQQLNDIGFYIYAMGSNADAMKIYSAIEKISPNRTVLLLNIADSLWESNNHGKSIEYYKRYIKIMDSAGKSQKIPPRVLTRAKAQ